MNQSRFKLNIDASGTAHYSNHSIVPQMPIDPKSHWSDDPLFRKSKSHCSNAPLIPKYSHQSLSPSATPLLFTALFHVSFCLNYFIKLEFILSVFAFFSMVKVRQKLWDRIQDSGCFKWRVQTRQYSPFLRLFTQQTRSRHRGFRSQHWN